MKCVKCGHENYINDNVCRMCGNFLGTRIAPTVVQTISNEKNPTPKVIQQIKASSNDKEDINDNQNDIMDTKYNGKLSIILGIINFIILMLANCPVLIHIILILLSFSYAKNEKNDSKLSLAGYITNALVIGVLVIKYTLLFLTK